MAVKGYNRVKQKIETLLETSVFPRGSRVPAERALATRLSATLGEIRLAVNKLAMEGKLVRVARKGTFVPKSDIPFLRKKQPVWAVLVRDLQYFYPPLVEAIEQEARKLGVMIVLGCVGGDVEVEKQLIHRRIAEGVSGIILAPVQPYGPKRLDCQNPLSVIRPAGSLDYLSELPVPVVVIDHFGMDMPNIGVDCVLKDDFAGAYQAIVHLVQHGYRKIAYFDGLAPGQTSQPYEFIQRMKGFQAALDDYGLSLPELPRLLAWHIDHDVSPIQKHLEAGVQAFAFGDDSTAAEFIRMLEKWGVKIPEDVAVMGFDDDRICTLVKPTITSIRPPREEMAKKAVKFLRDRIETGSKNNYRSILLKPTVVARASCGKSCPLPRSPAEAAIPCFQTPSKNVAQMI